MIFITNKVPLLFLLPLLKTIYTLFHYLRSSSVPCRMINWLLDKVDIFCECNIILKYMPCEFFVLPPRQIFWESSAMNIRKVELIHNICINMKGYFGWVIWISKFEPTFEITKASERRSWNIGILNESTIGRLISQPQRCYIIWWSQEITMSQKHQYFPQQISFYRSIYILSTISVPITIN